MTRLQIRYTAADPDVGVRDAGCLKVETRRAHSRLVEIAHFPLAAALLKRAGIFFEGNARLLNVSCQRGRESDAAA